MQDLDLLKVLATSAISGGWSTSTYSNRQSVPSKGAKDRRKKRKQEKKARKRNRGK